MTEMIGAAIKEARTAAGMTQKALAEAVDGVNAKGISAAERGLKELTEEQLEAIAQATGTDKKLFGIENGSAPEKTAAAPTALDREILELLGTADPAVKKAALGVLKGETAKSKGLLDDVLPLIGGVLGGNASANQKSNPVFAIVGFLASSEGKAFLETVKDVVGNIADTFDLSSTDGNMEHGESVTNSFLAFTFFYTVAVYILLIGFFYWQGRDDKPAGPLGQ